jgi:hypothetical protein
MYLIFTMYGNIYGILNKIKPEMESSRDGSKSVAVTFNIQISPKVEPTKLTKDINQSFPPLGGLNLVFASYLQAYPAEQG